MIAAASIIVPGVDFSVALPLTTQADPSQPTTSPATGLQAVEFWLSDTFGGPAIDPALVAPAEESVTTPGTYLATFAGAITAPFLTPRMGRTIYVVAESGASLTECVGLFVASSFG